MVFKNRQDAGEKLTAKLLSYQESSETIVIGLPRGGVEVAFWIAKNLKLPLDIIVPRKIGAPSNPEFAIGAVCEDGTVILNEYTSELGEVTDDYIQREAEKERQEAQRRINLYRSGCLSLNLKDKAVILADDGIATGATMQAAISSAKDKGAKEIIIAIPVAPEDTLNQIKKNADKVICLFTPVFFDAVGSFYDDFGQVSDEEVISLMRL